MGGVSSNDTAQYFFDCYEQKVSLPTEKTWLLGLPQILCKVQTVIKRNDVGGECEALRFFYQYIIKCLTYQLSIWQSVGKKDF